MTEQHRSQTRQRNLLTRPPLLLRFEGLAILATSVAFYLVSKGHWGYLFLGFLADLSFVGYAVNPRFGATLYNLMHTTSFPLILVLVGLSFGFNLTLLVGLVWLTHIGLDRAAGYGLKYPDAFKHTHIN